MKQGIGVTGSRDRGSRHSNKNSSPYPTSWERAPWSYQLARASTGTVVVPEGDPQGLCEGGTVLEEGMDIQS